MKNLAIIACGGMQPVEIANAWPDAMIVTLEGIDSLLRGKSYHHKLEKIGTLFAALQDAGIEQIVFAGTLTRPVFNPADFDSAMMSIAPRLVAAMQQGDDGLLRTVIAIFEEQGFQVVGVYDLLPDNVAQDSLCAGSEPGEAELKDAERAADILKAIAPLDIGQGCVVAGGQCLGIETVQGTDALLDYVAQSDARLRRGFKGVYVKAAKAGQDMRMDMPVIGETTIASVARAGLAGLVIESGRVMVLDREAVLKKVEKTGIFLISKAL